MSGTPEHLDAVDGVIEAAAEPCSPFSSGWSAPPARWATSRPAPACGPTARNIHAPDEAVELASIVRGAQTLARFILRFFADGGLPGAHRGRARQRVRS